MDLRKYLEATIDVQRRMLNQGTAVTAAADILVKSFSSGNKLLLCGNGGSAADCQHMAAELASSLDHSIERPGLPAVALTTDTSFLTAFANDFNFAGVFERQVRALGKSGDVLIAISTSGTSDNVIRAAAAARELGLTTIGLTGEGGRLETIVDQAIVVPSRDTQHIQEALLPIEHILCLVVERRLFAGEPSA